MGKGKDERKGRGFCSSAVDEVVTINQNAAASEDGQLASGAIHK